MADADFTLPDQPRSAVGFIYGLIERDSKILRYVGKTSLGIEDRLKRHMWAVSRGSRLPVHEWMRSCGVPVTVVLLEAVNGRSALNAAEQRWIEECRNLGVPLTNIRTGGEGGGGFRLTLEQRAKIAESNRRRFADPCARDHLRSRMREMKIAPPRVAQSEAHRLRLAELARLPKTSEARAAMSRAARRRLENPVERERLIGQIAGSFGKPLPLETREKISKATKGVPKSQEARARMRAAWVLRRNKGQ